MSYNSLSRAPEMTSKGHLRCGPQVGTGVGMLWINSGSKRFGVGSSWALSNTVATVDTQLGYECWHRLNLHFGPDIGLTNSVTILQIHGLVQTARHGSVYASLLVFFIGLWAFKMQITCP